MRGFRIIACSTLRRHLKELTDCLPPEAKVEYLDYAQDREPERLKLAFEERLASPVPIGNDGRPLATVLAYGDCAPYFNGRKPGEGPAHAICESCAARVTGQAHWKVLAREDSYCLVPEWVMGFMDGLDPAPCATRAGIQRNEAGNPKPGARPLPATGPDMATKALGLVSRILEGRDGPASLRLRAVRAVRALSGARLAVFIKPEDGEISELDPEGARPSLGSEPFGLLRRLALKAPGIQAWPAGLDQGDRDMAIPALEALGVDTALVVSLRTGNRLMGAILALGCLSPERLSEAASILAPSAGVLALALENARLAADRDASPMSGAKALARSEERLRLAVEASQDAIMDLDPQTGILFLSDRFMEHMGYAPGSVIPSNERIELSTAAETLLSFVHPDDRKPLVWAIERLSRSGAANRVIAFRFLANDGSYHDIRASLASEETDVRVPAGTRLRVIGTMADVTDENRAKRSVESALHEKEILLKEIHHRVKNNLQVIASLLNLEADNDPALASSLANIQIRVRSMAIVHELLYQTGDFSALPLQDYARRILDEVRDYADPVERIAIEIEPFDLKVGIDTALSLGMILVELAGNAYKHAFPDGRTGSLTLRLDETGLEKVLELSDDGAGYRPRRPGLGSVLVAELASQVKGSVSYLEREGGGTRVRVSFFTRSDT